MAEAPEGMTIIEVLPYNYDEIIKRSEKTQRPYTKEDLDRMMAEARAKNNVAMVMFMGPGFWAQGERKKQ